MTREEIIRNLKYTMEKHKNDTVSTFEINISAMCKDILDCLEQEPCDDAISRQAVLEKAVYTETEEGWCGYTVDVDFIKSLPPVNPQEPKTGHWTHGGFCSECGCDVPAYIIDWKWQKDMDAKYCPICGAKMVEPQESEG